MLNEYMKKIRVKKNLHPTLVALSLRKPVCLLLEWEAGSKVPDAADLFRWCGIIGADYREAAKELCAG